MGSQTPEIVMKFKMGQPVTVEVNGMVGSACRAFSAPFEQIIGGKVISDTPKPEIHQQGVVGAGIAANA